MFNYALMRQRGQELNRFRTALNGPVTDVTSDGGHKGKTGEDVPHILRRFRWIVFLLFLVTEKIKH